MSITEKQLYDFLKKVDNTFPVPISEKQNLLKYAEKLLKKATLCCKFEDEEIVSMVAGYTDNLTDNIAYIALVVTVEEAQGKGYAKKLIEEFINSCKEKGIMAVHLYTHPTNEKAIKMYKGLGFGICVPENERRPNDVHLIYDGRDRNK